MDKSDLEFIAKTKRDFLFAQSSGHITSAEKAIRILEREVQLLNGVNQAIIEKCKEEADKLNRKLKKAKKKIKILKGKTNAN